MKIDVIVAEIGSTTTIVNAFDGINTSKAKFLGQGQSPTTVLDGDVTIGLEKAILKLKESLNTKDLTWNKMFATSSAAGGLKMTVHGLVYDMTVKAAKEAALGAGGIISMITCGKLRRTDIAKISEHKPNIILIAGGVDYGERDTAIHNFELISRAYPNIPIIYAGNIQNHDEIKLISEEYKNKVYIVDNVYPKVDMLNIEPTRKVIHDVFEEHIIYAPGMESVRRIVNGSIMPTPGSVMEAAKLLKDSIGDLVVFDVGGATTDIHSVTSGTDEVSLISISPEPESKRTVEGDLGVYVNVNSLVNQIGLEELRKKLPDIEKLVKNINQIPISKDEINFIEILTQEAVLISLERHAGVLRDVYSTSGKKTFAEGKDLTAVKYIIGTGGALTRLPSRVNILEKISINSAKTRLFPNSDAKVLIDNEYIMASIGVLSKEHPKDALNLLKLSLRM